MPKQKLYQLEHTITLMNGCYHQNILGVNTYEECKSHIINAIYKNGYDWETAFTTFDMIEKDNFQFSKYKIRPCKSKQVIPFLY